jgi:hypothetical protein
MTKEHVIYIRVSTKPQDTASQEPELRRWARLSQGTTQSSVAHHLRHRNMKHDREDQSTFRGPGRLYSDEEEMQERHDHSHR